jgi:hypothetical protein
LENHILAESAVPRALSNNENWIALALQTAELSVTEYAIFRFSIPLHSTFGTGNGNEEDGLFLSGLVYLIINK